MALFSAFGGLAALLLLLVPVGRVTIPFPDQIVLAMQCAKDAGEHQSDQISLSLAQQTGSKFDQLLQEVRLASP